MRGIDDRVIEGDFAVAVHMHIAKAYPARLGNLCRRWKRLIATDDAVTVIVGDGDVARPGDLKRQRKPAFAALLFGLQGVQFPVLYAIELNLIAHMMLAR